jgi:PilZ domain
MKQERHGLRFLFDARAEVAPEGSPSNMVVARATEISLNGAYIETSTPFAVHALIFIKLFHEDAYFEGKARVVHVQAASGMGVSFRELKPHCQSVLQKWILLAMRSQPSESAPLD